MSAIASAESSSGKGALPQDCELNIASIIDCLTVLITYLLAVASFISIAAVEAQVESKAPTISNPSDPPPLISIRLMPDKRIEVSTEVSGQAPEKQTIPSLPDGGWNFLGVTQNLEAAKQKYSMLKFISFSADNSIEYLDIVKTVETIKSILPVEFANEGNLWPSPPSL